MNPYETPEQKRIRRQAKKVAGICTDCSNLARMGKTRCERCAARQKQNYHRRYAQDAEYRAKMFQANRQWQTENPERTREIRRKSRKRLHMICKQEAVHRYGGACACCGETEIRFLTLDHANGDGAAHREQILGNSRYGGSPFTFKLKELGWPEVLGLRVLCANCHMAIDLWGECPHQSKAILADTAGDPETEALR